MVKCSRTKAGVVCFFLICCLIILHCGKKCVTLKNIYFISQEYKADLKSENCLNVSCDELKVLTCDSLKKYLKEGILLRVDAKEYSIEVNGNNIVNFRNTLNLEVNFKKEHQGISFIFNGKRNLPCDVRLVLNRKFVTGKYLYLYNESQKKYVYIGGISNDSMILDEGGKYLLTDKKLECIKINGLLYTGLGCILLIYIIVNVFTQKRYLFW